MSVVLLGLVLSPSKKWGQESQDYALHCWLKRFELHVSNCFPEFWLTNTVQNLVCSAFFFPAEAITAEKVELSKKMYLPFDSEVSVLTSTS